jgi:hypothetical protein
MFLSPTDPNLLYFCTLRPYFDGDSKIFTDNDIPGLYVLDLQSQSVSPILLRVPLHISDAVSVSHLHKDSSISRPIGQCNNLQITDDGKSIFWTESFTYGNTIDFKSDEIFREIISLGENGHIWRVELGVDPTVQSVISNVAFPDGLLIEYSSGQPQSILFSELSKARLSRVYIHGSQKGQMEVVRTLPGYPDGLVRDPSTGNVFCALVNIHDDLGRIVAQYPFLQKILVRFPETWIPVSMETGFIVLSPDATEPLLYVHHDGSFTSRIADIILNKGHIYLAAYNGIDPSGIIRIPTSKLLL